MDKYYEICPYVHCQSYDITTLSLTNACIQLIDDREEKACCAMSQS